MNEKGRGFLRWPWNVVIYVLLAFALGIFAIPVILLLLWIQGKGNPHGASEGYCLSRTRKHLLWLLWAVLALVVAVSLAAVFIMGMGEDRTYWEHTDYALLVVSGGGSVLLCIVGIYLGYVAVRDTFFPARSALAQSIRNQLPHPQEAPDVAQLFGMVDNDLAQNGLWFGPVGVGREWVLGDAANKIDRIRGIFVIDELHHHHTETGNRTTRNMELVLVDDCWRRTSTRFNSIKNLRDAADCLALRCPDAVRGTNGDSSAFMAMDESARQAFEWDFHQKQSQRASERLQQEVMGNISQDMILKAGRNVTSRVTEELVEEHLRRCLDGELAGFSLTPTRPGVAAGGSLRALHVSVADGNLWLMAELQEHPGYGPAKRVDKPEARRILSDWLCKRPPDTEGWELRQLDFAKTQGRQERREQEPQARLSLLYASGAAENHTTFTREDVEIAADGIVDGTYQLADLTHPGGYMWIRVTAGNKSDGRCTVEATRPEGAQLGFYMAKMSPPEAAAWLKGYPDGRFLPGGPEWKKIKKPI